MLKNTSDSAPSVFVWRTVTEPKIGRINGCCIYCGKKLIDHPGQMSSPTRELIARAQRDRFGKLLSEMTEEDWMPFREEAIRVNSRQPESDHLEPTDLDGMIDLFGMLYAPLQGVCPRCGWWLDVINSNHGACCERTASAALKRFDLVSPDLAIAELESHLARNFSDIYLISPRRFEEIIAEIYRQIGWNVELTKQSRDGGIDLFCFSRSSGDICIVECKRYSGSRTVGIGFVDRLLGVAVRNGARHAHLVTSSFFTGPAVKAEDNMKDHEIALSLIDAHDLARLLNIYSDPEITVRDVAAIFREPPTID